MLKKILIPLDGSDTAEAILPFAQEVARGTGASVVLVTAVQQVGVWDATLSLKALDNEQEMAQQYLDEVSARVRAAGLDVDARVVPGDAAEAILNTAQEIDAGLVAISTHGRSGLSRWLFGSVATKLLENSPVPVLFLRPKEGTDKGAPGPVIKKILVPLDGSEVAMSVLPFVEEFAKTMGATLALYHSVTPITSYPGFEAAGASSVGTLIDELQAQSKQILSDVAAGTTSRGIETTIVVALDVAVDGILQAADDVKADLIAIGTHGRGGVKRAVLGSVADGVVRRSADVPCLVIRSTDPSGKKPD